MNTLSLFFLFHARKKPMALNIKSPRVDALARELAAMRKQTITEVIEAGLDALKRQEAEARETLQAQKKLGLEALLVNLQRRRIQCADPRTIQQIRDELWDFI
jgi:hypothetical protein